MRKSKRMQPKFLNRIKSVNIAFQPKYLSLSLGMRYESLSLGMRYESLSLGMRYESLSLGMRYESLSLGMRYESLSLGMRYESLSLGMRYDQQKKTPSAKPHTSSQKSSSRILQFTFLILKAVPDFGNNFPLNAVSICCSIRS